MRKRDYAELLELTKIYMGEVTDWHLQVQHLVSDGNFDAAKNILPPYNIALSKLAGAVSKLIPEPGAFRK